MHLFRWFVVLVGFACLLLTVWLYRACGGLGVLRLGERVVCIVLRFWFELVWLLWFVFVGGLLRMGCACWWPVFAFGLLFGGFCCRWQWLRCSGGLLGLVMHGLVVVVCGLFPSCFDLWVGVDYDLVLIAGCGFLSSSTLFLMGFGLIW